jgi:hypothetical protein
MAKVAHEQSGMMPAMNIVPRLLCEHGEYDEGNRGGDDHSYSPAEATMAVAKFFS